MEAIGSIGENHMQAINHYMEDKLSIYTADFRITPETNHSSVTRLKKIEKFSFIGL